MPLDVAAEARFFAPFFRRVVLLAVGNETVGARMFGVWFGGAVALPARMKLLQNFIAGFLAVTAFGVILGPFLVSVAVLHEPLSVNVSRF